MVKPIDANKTDGDKSHFVVVVASSETTKMSSLGVQADTVQKLNPHDGEQPPVAKRFPNFGCQEKESSSLYYQSHGKFPHDIDDNNDEACDVDKKKNDEVKGDDDTLIITEYEKFGDNHDQQHRVSRSAPRHDRNLGPINTNHQQQMTINNDDVPGAVKPTEAFLLARCPTIDHEIHQSTAAPNRDVPRQVSESGDTVVAISIDEAEVRRRHEDDIFKRIPEAEVLPDTRKRRRLCIATIFLGIVVVIAVALIASLVGRRGDDDPLNITVAPPLPTQAPTMSNTAFSDNFWKRNATVAIGDQLVAAPNHSLLVSYLNFSNGFGFNYTKYATNITLFAPTDESFQNLWKEEPFSFYLTETLWGAHFGRLLGTHIVIEQLSTSQIFALETIPAFSPGVELTVNGANSTIENDASIVVADVLASNGYIQVPDRVILIEPFRQTLFEWVLDPLHDSTTFTLNAFRQLLSFITTVNQDVLQVNLKDGFTLCVPTDAAFASVYPNITDFLLAPGAENTTQDLINYHMVLFNTYRVWIQALQEFNYPSVTSFVSVWFTANHQNEVFINGARILESHILKNGVLHVIDQVLKAPRMGELLELTTNVTMNFNFATFLHIVKDPAHQLDDLITGTENRTAFAPLEIAFEGQTDLITRLLRPQWLEHLQNLVSHHFTKYPIPSAAGNYEIPMQSGFNVSLRINSDGSVAADDITSEDIVDAKYLRSVNGIFYVVGDLLLPPWIGHSIPDEVMKDTEFSTLALLLDMANLSSLLNGASDAPMTLLAPSNAAFSALGSLTSLNTSYVQDLLLGHIFAGNLYSTELNATVVAVNNRTWNVQRVKGSIYIGGALLLSLDNLASNGLVHGIDRVLQVSSVS